MTDFPLDVQLIQSIAQRHQIRRIGTASIRELVTLVNDLEKSAGVAFLRMELGVPGIPAAETAVEAEIEALRRGCASRYPNIRGVKELRREAARFLKAFLDIEFEPRCCLPTAGSTNASFLSFMVTTRRRKDRGSILFLDPGFPVHKAQIQVLGLTGHGLDIYQHRGSRLRSALERILSRGNVAGLLFSNPNNPSWMCLTEEELRTIGELCTKYDVVALEDLAYLTMDFRRDLSLPGQPPFQPTVARYTNNALLLISSSKLFSLAGERVGLIAMSSSLYDSRSPALAAYFNSEIFGHCLSYGALYAVSAGVNHSAQYGLAAVLRNATAGKEPMLHRVREYGRRAALMKPTFLRNGFRLVYDRDDQLPLAEGFYFTVAYPGLSGDQLVAGLLQFGVSAISLARTGSEFPEAVRACVSQVEESDIPELERRLALFHRHFSQVERESARPSTP